MDQLVILPMNNKNVFSQSWTSDLVIFYSTKISKLALLQAALKTRVKTVPLTIRDSGNALDTVVICFNFFFYLSKTGSAASGCEFPPSSHQFWWLHELIHLAKGPKQNSFWGRKTTLNSFQLFYRGDQLTDQVRLKLKKTTLNTLSDLD